MLYNNILLLKLKEKFTKNLPSIKGFVKILNKKTVILETDNNDIYHISCIYLKNIMEGDYILANIQSNNNKLNVIPIKLLKSNLNIFEGIVKKKTNIIYVIPKKKILYNNIIKCVIGKDIKNNFKDGDKVIAKIIQHPLLKKGNGLFLAEITEILTINNKHLKPWWKILLKYNLSINSPSNNLCKKIEFLDKNIHREDLTKLFFITIDNKDTKDIDDALYIEKISKEELLIYIAISDPTSYIKKDSKIDKIASERMFTNYLPGLTISLLPKKLSENFCSLHPNKKRPVLICKIIIDKNGFLNKKIVFFTGWIKSKAKLNYHDVSDFLEKKGIWEPNNKIKQQIFLLYKFYLYRKKWNYKNIVNFNNIDYKFIIDNKGTILDIVIEKKRIAHKIIETAMITANICASEILYKNLGFGIYNTYYGFNINKINKITELLNKYNIKYNKSFLMTLKGYKTIYNKLQDLKLSFVLNRIKKYQLITLFNVKPGPHFSLGLKRYATWTSPIRKFGDMINHRLIKSIINKEYNIKKPLDTIYINMNQKRYLYRQAQKDLYNFLYLQYFKNISIRNKIFICEIIDILYYGIKIRFIENGAYAFIPKKFLSNNLMINQEKGIILNNNELFFKVTDKIKVIIKKININGIIAKLI
ncbi:exoribonuclease II [Enterobacteriaceae endosymbiont of Donacia marginata]|uniref:exoribonuclease II n=1 Tax=Enterobacteriaceae endosymbiont of Donacia marginata TaxID=2675779 RepID=UPI0014495602|nr:exoribonuclease II [Enterobacteriaceae endosymbiont of Donacia marginata]QJC37971.1 exoribonuclease II [Enterobacteriaceae endosymbiont of Donacia marginata]